MIKAVIFDLNKVIVTYDKTNDYYIKELGIKREDFWKNREQNLEDYTLGKINLNEFLLLQLKQSKLSSDKLEVVKKLHDDGLRIVEGIIHILDVLFKRYKLILMAGEGEESVDIKLNKFDLRKYFNKVYATYLSKMNKTETKFYQNILSENELKPSEVLFIDDQQRYIDAATSIGIKTIKFEDVSQLKKELFRLKIIKL